MRYRLEVIIVKSIGQRRLVRAQRNSDLDSVVSTQGKLGSQAHHLAKWNVRKKAQTSAARLQFHHDSTFAISNERNSGDGCTEASSGQHQSSQLLDGIDRVAKMMTENRHAYAKVLSVSGMVL